MVRYIAVYPQLREILLSQDTIPMVSVSALGRHWKEYPTYARLTYGAKQGTMFAVLACTCKQVFNMLILDTNPWLLTPMEKEDLLSRDTTLSVLRVTRFESGCAELTINCDSDSEDLYDYPE